MCLGKHICQVSSQCNGTDSLCLVSDMFSRQCRCDARASIREEILSNPDSFNCASKWLGGTTWVWSVSCGLNYVASSVHFHTCGYFKFKYM